MTDQQLPDKLIHRYALNATLVCGASLNQKRLVSTSGVGVTCPGCK